MAKRYSWHKEYYDKSIKQIADYCVRLLDDCAGAFSFDGILDWLEKEHPEHYKKYSQALDLIGNLFGKMDPKSMEEFKAAVKIEKDATLWAATNYIEMQKKEAECDELKGTQGALI
jgi:glycine betaine/choline ABC-type transport system substrate-binding protein